MKRAVTVLYGLRQGVTEEWREELLLSDATPAQIARVKVLAARDGWHSFRTATIDLTKPPDWAATVRV